MFALIIIGGVIAGIFTYEQWMTWRRTTEWRRVQKQFPGRDQRPR
jgi:transposase